MRKLLNGSVIVLLIIVLLIIGCSRVQYPSTKTEYQSILLTSGQVFFGKIEKNSSPYLKIKDVFYIQSQIDKQTNQVKTTLVRRGNELHGPNEMFLNPYHIVAIEPVTQNSKLIDLIKELDAERREVEREKANRLNGKPR